MGSEQRPYVEALRGLHGNKILACDGLDDVLARDSLDCVTERHSGNDTGHVSHEQSVDDPPHNGRGHERSCRVVNEYQAFAIGNPLKTGSDGILASIAPGDGAVEVPYYDQFINSPLDQRTVGPLPHRNTIEFKGVLLSSEAGSPSGRQQNPPNRNAITHMPDVI